MSVPPTHRYVTVSDDTPEKVVIQIKALPSLDEGDILVKIIAVAINPSDHRHIWDYHAKKPGDSMGYDFSGIVVQLGSDAEGRDVKVGDAVAGFCRGGDATNGAFQEYIKTRPELVWHVPTDIVSFEAAAAMGGLSLATSMMALYYRLNLPPAWEPTTEPFPILVWGGSTSIGIFAIRLAKLSGLRVATTASPKNHALLKSLGADVVFDYHDPTTPQQIHEWAGGNIQLGIDAYSAEGSPHLAAAAFSEAGGKLVTVLPVRLAEGATLPNAVEPIAFRIPMALDPKNKEEYEGLVDWYKRLPDLAKELNILPLRHQEGGLDAIPDALQYIRAGKVSAEKITLTVAQP